MSGKSPRAFLWMSMAPNAVQISPAPMPDQDHRPAALLDRSPRVELDALGERRWRRVCPPESEPAKAGLDTSIVSAVAAQLDARIILRSAEPGTIVLIDHTSHIGLACFECFAARVGARIGRPGGDIWVCMQSGQLD